MGGGSGELQRGFALRAGRPCSMCLRQNVTHNVRRAGMVGRKLTCLQRFLNGCFLVLDAKELPRFKHVGGGSSAPPVDVSLVYQNRSTDIGHRFRLEKNDVGV